MKIVNILLRIALVLVGLILLAYAVYWGQAKYESGKVLESLGPEVQHLTDSGLQFRDLNQNNRLDRYEDHRLSADERADNLIELMTLEEKAGCLFYGMIGMTDEGDFMDAPMLSSDPLKVMVSNFIPHAPELIVNRKINSFAPLGTGSASVLARYNNVLQDMASRTRLGIPVTLATDPRHSQDFAPGISQASSAFSSWPSQLGLAATRDTMLVRTFGDIARQEYLATGFRVALHPMADIATEPRWPRFSGTFGEDVDIATAMLRNYIQGFQGDSLSSASVACMAKHFPGSGTHTEGDEPHFEYGAEQSYSGNNFGYHVRAFSEGTRQTAQIMTSYGIAMSQTSEDVAAAFNKELISDLLRDSLDFEGVVCTDWNVITDTPFMKFLKGGSSSWGVKELSPLQRMQKAIQAGVDQFGGEHATELIVQLVNENMVSEQRIDQSVKRILKDKFRLGLFDNPYVNENKADHIANDVDFQKAALQAQRKSIVLLKNDDLLPLKKGTRVFMENVRDKDVVSSYAELVDNYIDAEVIIKHIDTPFEPKNDYLMESFMGQTGRLYFTQAELSELLNYVDEKPNVFIINLKRPAILTEINQASKALLAEFGSSDRTLMEVIFGDFRPSGKLPFELPSSWQSVENQLEDVPYDSKDPLYPFGHGLSY